MSVILVALLAIVVTTDLFLGLVVYLNGRRTASNLSFAIFVLAVVAWALANFLTDIVRDADQSLFWCRMSFVAASLIALSFFIFSLRFPSGKRIKTTSSLVLIFWSILTVGLSGFTPFIVKSVILHSWGASTINGSMFFLFPAYFLVLMFLAFLNLASKFRHSLGAQRSRIQYLFIGVLTSALVALITNLVHPLLSGETNYAKFGPLGTVFFVAFSAYAIIKHRLMDIRLLVLKSVTYSVLLAVIAAAYVTGALYIKQGYETVVDPSLLYVITGFLLVLGFQPLKNLIQKYTDKIFAKGRYSPQELLTKLGKIFSANVILEDLTRAALETLTKEMRLKRAAFIILSNNEIAEVKKIGYKEVSKLNWRKAIEMVTETEKIFVADEQEELSKNKEILRKVNTEILLPLSTEKEMVGLLALGEKASGDMFTAEDLRVLEVIAPQAAIALNNASLVKEKERRIAELNALNKLALSLGSTLNLNEILEQVIDDALRITGAESGSIMLLDETQKTLTIMCARGISPRISNRTSSGLGEGLAGWVAQRAKPVNVSYKLKDEYVQAILKSENIVAALAVPLKVKEKVIGVLNVIRRKKKEEFTEEDLNLVTSFAAQAAEAIENARLHKKSEDQFMETINSLSKAVDAKDHYTYGHSGAVTKHAIEVAKEMRLSWEEIRNIEIAARLHDIGKIGIPESILNKAGQLSEDERKIINEHPKMAIRILKTAESLREIKPLIHFHHERYDGSGYPAGLTGKGIPLGARIIAVADAFDAMRTKRPYRKVLSLEEAVNELQDKAGTQFDPEVVKVFLKVLGWKSQKEMVVA